MATDRFDKIAEADAEWLARAARYRHGEISAEELGDRPLGRQEFPHNVRKLYNFGPPYISWLDNLVVLGRGYLNLDATVVVAYNMDGSGAIDIKFNFWFEDWFRDAFDMWNIFDDAKMGYLEFDNGTPYVIRGQWGIYESAAKALPGSSWLWAVPQTVP